jgi:hypothetical protein
MTLQTFNSVMQPLKMVPTKNIIFLQLQHTPNCWVEGAKYVNIRSWENSLPTNSDISYHKPSSMTDLQNKLLY